MASPKHFLDLSAVSAPDLRRMLDDARVRKQATKSGTADKPLAGKMLAMSRGETVAGLVDPGTVPSSVDHPAA